MSTSLQKTLARYFGPVLMEKKPASLLSLPKVAACELSTLYREHIKSHVLYENETHQLVLIYHSQLLQAALIRPAAKEILSACGYPLAEGLASMPRHLQMRMQKRTRGDFPHEVGLFLGYPSADVEGFILHQGRDYKFCGEWKVYGSIKTAQKLFAEYNNCRNSLLTYIEQGGSLSNFPTSLALL